MDLGAQVGPNMSSYRDELEAAHARADALSREVKRAHAEIEELKGGGLIRMESERALTTLYGHPSESMSTTVDGGLTTARIEALIQRLREHFGVHGRLESLDECATWSATHAGDENPWILVTMRSVGDETSIRIDYRAAAAWSKSSLIWRVPLYSAPITLGLVPLAFALAWPPWVIALPAFAMALLLAGEPRAQRKRAAETRATYQGLLEQLALPTARGLPRPV